ncbi:retrovirus-related pol polyprotein from transposon TNT 1-94 [Tanacetum coccineum]
MNANTFNDPLYIASSDHPGMILTKTSFNDTSDLWKEIGERYGQSNGPLVYQLERELSKITQGYPDWYKGKKAKKGNRLAAQVNSGFDEHFNGESPFDLGYENEAGILSCFTTSFALFFHHDMNILLDWKSDIGSSDHMSPHLNLFISTENLKTAIIGHDVLMTIRSDNGPKISSTCSSLFQSKGILHQKSMVYTPQQNGRERESIDTARTIRLHADLPIKFWGDCILVATYLINKMPMEVLSWKTPFEKLFGTLLVYDHLRVIGCLCYAAVTIPHKDKFDKRGTKCVLSWISCRGALWRKTILGHSQVLPPGHKPISSKWVYKTKYNPDGTVERVKARLVVRGFNQQERLDYKHNFSFIAKLATAIHLLKSTSQQALDIKFTIKDLGQANLS